jgi:DNA-binding NarL/FixJ family response regulator
MKPIRLLVIEDHELVREGVRFILSGLNMIEVVGIASTPAEAFQLLGRSSPDVVLTDLGLPTMETGIGVIEDIKSQYPRVRVLAFTVHEDAYAVHAALNAGANGYILKSASIDEFETAITTVAAGKFFLSPGVSAHVVDGYLNRGASKEADLSVLSRREREVLRLISEGRGNKEIGAALFISPRTVEKHKESLKKKLQCNSSVELALFSLRSGLIQ